MSNWAAVILFGLAFNGCSGHSSDGSNTNSNSNLPPVSATEQSGKRLVKASGWSLPSLPEKKDVKSRTERVGDKEIATFTARYQMKLIRFKEPFDALGFSEWGRLTTVTEFLSEDQKPFCYELTAETDWNQSNQRVGALIKIYLLDSDRDGTFDTLSDRYLCSPQR